jgi:hypothetical protein
MILVNLVAMKLAMWVPRGNNTNLTVRDVCGQAADWDCMYELGNAWEIHWTEITEHERTEPRHMMRCDTVKVRFEDESAMDLRASSEMSEAALKLAIAE